MFMEKDERLIISDVHHNPTLSQPKYPVISISGLQKLEGVGVKTIYWDNFCFHQPDWEHRLNNILENTDLKILMPFWWKPPVGAEWLVGEGDEVDYANTDVGKSIDEFTLEFIESLSYTKNRTQLTYSYNRSGESVWMGEDARKVPPLPKEVVAEFIVERQKVLSTQYNEVWTNLHDLMVNPEPVKAMNDYLYVELPDCDHYRIQQAYYLNMHGSYNVRAVRRNPRSKYFCGSQYVPGLAEHYDAWMEHGVWGFYTGPIHLDTKETRIEDWMLEGIKVAIEKLRLEPDYQGSWAERPLSPSCDTYRIV